MRIADRRIGVVIASKVASVNRQQASEDLSIHTKVDVIRRTRRLAAAG
jgi:hypothetical protein